MPVSRLRNNDGFTLIELMTALVIGTIVIMAAFSLIDHAFVVNGKVASRSEATQRGRAAMDDITRALRSQVCVNNQPPVIAATPTSVTFTDDLSNGSRAPEKRQLVYDPVADTLTQSVWTGTNNGGNVTFAATPTTTPVVANTDTDPAVTPAGAVFTYWGIVPNTGGTSFTSLGSTVPATSVAQIARIDVAFVTRPTGAKTTDDRAVNFEDSVTVRSVDPTAATPGAQC
jgi:prepilin-type N-terminal cleavage/methylation domain-containing protein